MSSAEEIKDIEAQIEQILFNVMDPEINLNIVDLGLIYSLVFDGTETVEIKMTFSTPACPLGDAIVMSVKQSINNVFPDYQIDVQIVFDPPWTTEMISENGKLMLGM